MSSPINVRRSIFSSSSMEPTQIYAIVAGAMLCSLLLYRTCSRVSGWIQDRAIFYAFKYLIYPFFLRRRGFPDPITRWRVTLVSMCWLGTALCNVIEIKTLFEASKTAGVLSVLHLVPLLFSSRLSFAADLLGLSLKFYNGFHGLLGYLAFLQGLTHVPLQIIHNVFGLEMHCKFSDFWYLLFAFQVSDWHELGHDFFASIILLLIWKFPFYEFFAKTQFFLALMLAFAVWWHLIIRSGFASFYIIMTVFILLSTTLFRYVRIISETTRIDKDMASFSFAQGFFVIQFSKHPYSKSTWSVETAWGIYSFI